MTKATTVKKKRRKKKELKEYLTTMSHKAETSAKRNSIKKYQIEILVLKTK